jgi:hypothetical protein
LKEKEKVKPVYKQIKSRSIDPFLEARKKNLSPTSWLSLEAKKLY